MRSTHVFTFGLAASVVLLAAGCSNNSEAIKLPVQPTAAETSAAPTTSLAPSTTSLPTTTTAPTAATEAPTTAPPTTIDIETQIRADVERTQQTILRCGIAPEECAFDQYAVPGSDSDKLLRAYVQERLDTGLRVSANSGTLEVTVERIVVDGTRAMVQICEEDSRVLIDPRDPAIPGDDFIVNDDIGTRRETFEMRLLNDKWLLSAVDVASLNVGVLECVA